MRDWNESRTYRYPQEYPLECKDTYRAVDRSPDAEQARAFIALFEKDFREALNV